MSNVRGLQISSTRGAAALTPDQKRFNALIRQIDQARQTLEAWQEARPAYGETHVQLILPLRKNLAAAQRQWTLALDRQLDQPGWSKTERSTLANVICNSAAELLGAGDEDDAELKAVFDKHSDVDFETGQQLARDAMKEMAEAMTGLDLGDAAEIDSEEDLLDRLQKGLAEKAEGEQARAEAAPAPQRRQTAAQKRRQARAEAEAQQATQSVREIFRKLASALHPDRETDPAERATKTELMQRANQAYAANDLLALLELQLQIEQVDAGHIAQASAQRVKHYNKVLAEQLGELKHEIDRVEAGFRFDFDLLDFGNLNPARLGSVIEDQARELRAALVSLQSDMRRLANKPALKRWLKQERQRQRDEDAFDELFGRGYF